MFSAVVDMGVGIDDLGRRRRLEALFSEHSSAVRAYARRRVATGAARAAAVIGCSPRVFVMRLHRGRHRVASAMARVDPSQSQSDGGPRYLDSGRYSAGSLLEGRSPLTVTGVSIRNFANQSFGHITLTIALSYAASTVFAQVGVGVGPQQMIAEMRRRSRPKVIKSLRGRHR